MGYNVYIHINTFNNKSYIGITSQKCENRWGIEGSGYKLQPKFYQAIQKYGWNNFEHKILYTNLNKEEALLKESILIKKYDSINNGYNISPYGNVESKRILCTTTGEVFDSINEAANYGNISNSTLSHYLNGEWDSCGNKEGIKLTWEFLDLPEENIKAKQLREKRKQHREKKFYTEEALKIVEEYQQGASINQLTKKYSKNKETIKNYLIFHNIPIISSKERTSHPIFQLDKNKKIIKKFSSLTEAAKTIGIGENNIGRIKLACNEQWRTVKGYYWKWAYELEDDTFGF